MIRYTTSEGGLFTFPTSLEDITLGKYIDLLQLVEPTKPDELARLEDAAAALDDTENAAENYAKAEQALTAKVMYKKIYPYFARVVAFFADGITEHEILGGKKQGDGMNIGHLTLLYNNLSDILNNPTEPEYSQIIEDKDGELWYLPERFMEKAKLIEYAEACQFEENLTELQNGNWLALPKIMCVLVRKEGEMYSEKLLLREEMFFGWSLQKCLQVAFFLLKRSEISILNLRAFTAAQELTRLRQESSN